MKMKPIAIIVILILPIQEYESFFAIRAKQMNDVMPVATPFT